MSAGTQLTGADQQHTRAPLGQTAPPVATLSLPLKPPKLKGLRLAASAPPPPTCLPLEASFGEKNELNLAYKSPDYHVSRSQASGARDRLLPSERLGSVWGQKSVRLLIYYHYEFPAARPLAAPAASGTSDCSRVAQQRRPPRLTGWSLLAPPPPPHQLTAVGPPMINCAPAATRAPGCTFQRPASEVGGESWKRNSDG